MRRTACKCPIDVCRRRTAACLCSGFIDGILPHLGWVSHRLVPAEGVGQHETEMSTTTAGRPPDVTEPSASPRPAGRLRRRLFWLAVGVTLVAVIVGAVVVWRHRASGPAIA